MTLALQGTRIGRLKKENRKTVFLLMALNFVLLSGAMLLSTLLVSNKEFGQGMIVLAAVPPAIAVITAAFLLKADTDKALLAQAGCYIASLVITPLVVWIFFRGQVNIWELVKILVLLVIFPFILAKGFDWLKMKLGIRYDFKEVANLAFGLTFYMSVALAVSTILSSLSAVIIMLIIIAVFTFGLGVAVIFVAKRLGVDKKDLSLCSLFSTLKNGNLALGICISLFAVGSYVPIALKSTVDALYLVFLFWFFKKI